jgi:hypothetical protein
VRPSRQLGAEPVEAVAHGGDEAVVEHRVAVHDQDAFGRHEVALDDQVDAVGLRHRPRVLHDRDRRAVAVARPAPDRNARRLPDAALGEHVARHPQGLGHHARRLVAPAVDGDHDLVDALALREQRQQRPRRALLLVEHRHDGRHPVGAADRQAAIGRKPQRRVQERGGHGDDRGHLRHG